MVSLAAKLLIPASLVLTSPSVPANSNYVPQQSPHNYGIETPSPLYASSWNWTGLNELMIVFGGLGTFVCAGVVARQEWRKIKAQKANQQQNAH